MDDALTVGALGWVQRSPTGNRIRWTLPHVSTPAALPTAVGNELRTTFEQLAAATTVGAVTVERAILGPPGKWQPSRELPQELRPVPRDWWQPAGDVHLDSDIPMCEYTLDPPVQAVSFRLTIAPTRCLFLNRAAQQVVLDTTPAAGTLVVAAGYAIDTIRVYARSAVLIDLHTLDMWVSRDSTFEPLARVDIAAGLTSDLATVATRTRGDTIAPDPGDSWWAELSAWCRGEYVPGEEADPGLPSPWLRAALARAGHFGVALLTGTGFVDGPAGYSSRVPGDELLGTVLTEPEWVAYRVVSDATATASNLAVCPTATARRPLPPRAVRADRPIGAYVTQRDVYEIVTAVHWQPADGSASVILEEQAVDDSGTPVLDQETDCRRPERDADGYRMPRRIDLLTPDARLRWRLSSVDVWDQQSDLTDWTPAHRINLVHRPGGPAFARVTHDGATAKFRPEADPWLPDRAIRENLGHVNIYRQATEPRRLDVVIGTAVARPGAAYDIPVTGPTNLAAYDGGTLTAAGTVWSITATHNATLTVAAPATNATSARIPPPGAAILRQSPTLLANHRLVASLPVAQWLSMPLDATGEPYLPVPDPVPIDGAKLVYRAATEVDGQIGVPGPAVTTTAPRGSPISTTYTATGQLASADPARPGTEAGWGSAMADYYGRSLIVIRLAADDRSAGTYRIRAAPGGDSAPDSLTYGALGPQPATNATVSDLVALPLPIRGNATLWVGLERHRPDGVIDDLGTVRATIESPPVA